MSETTSHPYIIVEEHDPDIRNAPPPSRAGSTSRPHRVYRVPVSTPRPTPAPQWPPGPVGQPSGPIVPVPAQPGAGIAGGHYMMVAQTVGSQGKRRSIRVEKIADGIRLATDGLAAIWPLPDQPPPPTGDEAVDLANQNEHRHAIAARQLMVDRVRAAGRVLGGVLKLAFSDDDLSIE